MQNPSVPTSTLSVSSPPLLIIWILPQELLCCLSNNFQVLYFCVSAVIPPSSASFANFYCLMRLHDEIIFQVSGSLFLLLLLLLHTPSNTHKHTFRKHSDNHDRPHWCDPAQQSPRSPESASPASSSCSFSPSSPCPVPQREREREKEIVSISALRALQLGVP